MIRNSYVNLHNFNLKFVRFISYWEKVKECHEKNK